MSLKRAALGLSAVIAFPFAAEAQSPWEYRATLYGWFPAASATVETPVGELETDADFDEILETLDLAFLGALEARNGRWSFVGDLVYTDVSSETDAPLGGLFARGEVDAQTTLLSAYALYALADRDDLRFEVGGGVRYNHVEVDTFLAGQGATPDLSLGNSGDWADLLLAARGSTRFSDRWSGRAYVDIGGFGIEDSSDLSWQAFVGVGYHFNERWTAVGGYRHLSIERELDNADITVELSGPVLGFQASF